MKSTKERHQLAHSSSFRYKRPSSPYLVEDGESSSEHVVGPLTPFACPLEVNTSPLPVSPAYLKYPRDRSNSSCSHYRGSPYDLSVHSPDNGLFRRNSDPMAKNCDRGVLSPPLPMDMEEEEEEEYDQPLDMSKKSRIASSSSSSSSPPSESHHPSDPHHHHHHHLHHISSHRHNPLHHHHNHHHGSSSSSSSTSSRSNTCSPESIYKGNQMNGKSFIGCRPNSMYHNQPHHVYQQSPPPSTINSPTNTLINHHNHINSHNGNVHLQPRPSVITCASTLFGPRRSSSTSSNHHQTICSNNNNMKDESIYSSHHNHSQHGLHPINSGLNSDKSLTTGSPRPSSLQSTSSSSSLSSFSSSSSSCSSSFSRHHQSTLKSQTLRPETVNELNSFNKNGKKKLDGHSQLLIHGEDSDSGIDEHFRKSLGNHYRNYTNVSMSVDDHFAKALGPTWFKLQQESQNGSKGNSYNKANPASIPS